jgi:hypothetical protein
MRQQVDFNTFGVNYRTKEFAAAEAFGLIDHLDTLPPIEMLKYTDVMDEEKNWRPLNNPDVINQYVRDVCGIIRPHEVLHGLMVLIGDYNFAFLSKWRPVKIPARFVSDAEHVPLQGMHPIMSRLISEGMAKMNELQEYYSLEDAFSMYDIWANDGLNKALSSEASMKRAREKTRQ